MEAEIIPSIDQQNIYIFGAVEKDVASTGLVEERVNDNYNQIFSLTTD